MAKKHPNKPRKQKTQPDSFDELVNLYRKYAQIKGWNTPEEVIHEEVKAWEKNSGGNVGLAVEFHETTEHNAPHLPFLQAIIASPDDDAPRLVFADWLEEHGESERAELIRLQCSLSSLPSGASECAALQERVHRLLHACLDDFLKPLTRLGLRFGEESMPVDSVYMPRSTYYYLKAVFRRGFVEEITVRGRENLQTFARHAEACFRLTPLQHLEVTNIGGLSEGWDQGSPLGMMFPEFDSMNAEDLRALVQRPEMARLRTLLLRLNLGIQEARALADSPYLTAQTTLLLYPGVDYPETELTIDDYRRQALSLASDVWTAQELAGSFGQVQAGTPAEIEGILRARFGDAVRWCH